MLNQSHLEEMQTWTDVDLPNLLPNAENQTYEFKCSLTSDGKLQSLIQKAASGFWNSGGGYFVIGVDEKSGMPDGGIPTKVGRTARRDWIDRAISAVSPPNPHGYMIQEITAGQGECKIDSGKAIYIIGFAASELVPHMGDGHYYIRSGAHTDPAPHFLVEALFARRGKRQPQLRLEFRRDTILQDTLQLGVVNVGLVPAIDVEIEFELPPWEVPVAIHTGKCIAKAHLLDRDTPLYIGYLIDGMNQSEASKRLATETNLVTLKYKDTLLNSYQQEEKVNPKITASARMFTGSEINRIAWSLQHIVNALCRIEGDIKANPRR